MQWLGKAEGFEPSVALQYRRYRTPIVTRLQYFTTHHRTLINSGRTITRHFAATWIRLRFLVEQILNSTYNLSRILLAAEYIKPLRSDLQGLSYGSNLLVA